MKILNETQQAILTLIAERIESEGMPPSQIEIAQAFGFKGVRAAQYHLEALEAAGVIERLPGRARGIRLKHPVNIQTETHLHDVLQLPILGRVAAGAPIGADIATDDTVLLDKVFFSPAPDYLLKVQGDSMRDEGIFDGDLIGVHRTNTARNGQIVVARIDEEITIKVLQTNPQGEIRLLPKNPDYAPIQIQPDQDFAIEGLYCGLLRPNH